MSNSWAGTAEAYEASFARLCAGTVPDVLGSLGPARPGRRLLDVGCGPGTVARAAHRAGFTTVGLDADASMLSLARRKAPQVALVHGALPRLPCADEQFDAVAANFLVNHTPDPRAALRELRRVTRPGGRLVVTIWTGAVSPLNSLWNDVMAAASVIPPPSKSLPPDHDFDRTAEGLSGIMGEARLDDIAVREVTWQFRIPAADLWGGVVAGIATIGQAYRAQRPRKQVGMRDAYVRLTHERFPDGELRLPSSALLASACRPHPRA